MAHSSYRSGFEVRLAQQLTAGGVEFGYEETSYWYYKNIRGQCTQCDSTKVVSWHEYTPDFFLPSGIIVEAKGKWTSGHRTTILRMCEQHPELDLRMVFMRDNWLTKKKVRKYSGYCEQKGIPYAVGSIPYVWCVQGEQ